MTHFHSLLQGIKLCLSNSYNVFHIHMLMLLFSKFILHPEKMEVPNVKKKKKNYIKLARYNMQMTERGLFFLLFTLFIQQLKYLQDETS